MKLESLHLYSVGYGNEAHLTGTVCFSSPKGKVELSLKQEHIKGVLKAVADGLVMSAQEVATELTANIIEEAAPVLEAPHEN